MLLKTQQEAGRCSATRFLATVKEQATDMLQDLTNDVAVAVISIAQGQAGTSLHVVRVCHSALYLEVECL